MSTTATLKYIRHSVAGFNVWPQSLECVSHRDAAKVYQFSRDVCHGHILSAGFVKFEYGQPVCYGRSDSLGVASIPEDDTAALRAEWGMASPAATLSMPALEAARAFGASLDPVCLEQADAL